MVGPRRDRSAPEIKPIQVLILDESYYHAPEQILRISEHFKVAGIKAEFMTERGVLYTDFDGAYVVSCSDQTDRDEAVKILENYYKFAVA
jgi:hypothetical protein